MSATPSIKIIKTMGFKGGTRAFSNRYHFNGGTPADATHWHTLMDNIVNAEKATIAANVTITELIGYAAGSDVPVASKTYTQAGTLTLAANHVTCPGQTAALVRYSTSARTTKNHPIYLFNYYHGVSINGVASTPEVLDANQKSALQTYATAWITGFSDGTITAVRASPNAAAATGSVVEEYVTHRDFPYTPSL